MAAEDRYSLLMERMRDFRDEVKEIRKAQEENTKKLDDILAMLEAGAQEPEKGMQEQLQEAIGMLSALPGGQDALARFMGGKKAEAPSGNGVVQSG